MDGIKVGQVWRKQGPYGWLKIERILAPGHSDYDGGLPGCVARPTKVKNLGKKEA